MKKQSFFIILIIALALTVGIWRERNNKNAPINVGTASSPLNLTSGTALPIPQRLPKFQLENSDGTPFTAESLKQYWSFVFFGYTSCPDICPNIMGTLHEISQRLVGLPSVQYVFITIDPANDNKNRLNEYLQQFQIGEKALRGITGEKEVILAISKKLGVHVDEEANTNQKIEHSGIIFLINPDGKLTAIFTNINKPHAIVHDVKQIIHHYAMNG